MIEYISFECCKNTEESYAFTLRLDDDGYYYLKNCHGRRGMYIFSDEYERNYRIPMGNLEIISRMIESVHIYSWKKSYPDDYVPEERLLGCDVGSWSLDYKECEKRTTRHIHGFGNILETFPEVQLLTFFDLFFPDFDFKKWIYESVK